MFLRYLLFFILINPLSAIAATQTIQIYRWTDDSGINHLSQFPPEGKNNNFNVEKIQVSILISKPPKEESNKERMENIKKYIEERESARKMQIESSKTAQTNKKNCALARKNLELYQSGQRIRTGVNGNSDTQILTEKERLKRIKRSEKNFQSYC
jgi:anti-sigma28 factor (negative regulator of flagellin synthesis)